MKSLFKNLRTLTLAAIGLAGLAAVPANALPVTYNFSGIFTDGATASGKIAVNQYGYSNLAPTGIVTTTGIFSGYSYIWTGVLGSANVQQPLPLDYILVLSSPNYNRYLYLDFAGPLTGATDTLIANKSFECLGFGNLDFSCLGPAHPNNQIRYFSSGIAVPEPLTLSLFGAGLAGAAVLRRRKKKAQAV